MGEKNEDQIITLTMHVNSKYYYFNQLNDMHDNTNNATYNLAMTSSYNTYMQK